MPIYNVRKELTPEEFEQWFGFVPKEPLEAEELEKAVPIDRLFDAMRDELKMGSVLIFEKVYGATEQAYDLHSRFLRQVADCPSAVIKFCQEALAPDAKQKEQQMQKGDAEYEAKQVRIERARALDAYLVELEGYLQKGEMLQALELIARLRSFIA